MRTREKKLILGSSPKDKRIRKIARKLCSTPLNSCTKRKGRNRNDTLGKFIESLPKVSGRGSARPQCRLKLFGKKVSHLDEVKGPGNVACDGGISKMDHRRRQRRKRRKKKNTVRDEASCLQRRARYLLIRMKLELNLIDAYSGDGWKGRSKEKIKPDKELQRARKQILKCKLGIREAIRQLDMIGSEGHIADSVMHPDGSVFHEYIFCAKCKSHEAYPDDDIILCDGTCNCGFHQKCLEPPLEKIPPADQGWLCKICECKMEIVEAINVHIGTSFTVNSTWEDIFEEAATGADIGNMSLNPSEEWPSEDSNDEDYNPELIVNSTRVGSESMSDNASSSSFICSSDNVSLCSNSSNYHWVDAKSRIKKGSQHFNFVIDIDSGECSDLDITNYRRPRRDVNYKKLYDEMFGKDLNDNEQSEDEDWGPQRKKRRIELDVSTMIGKCQDMDGYCSTIVQDNIPCDRRKLFRIPSDALEKLRQVFSKNELPSRAVKENLALELGVSAEKVNKWFKNARYAALKLRKNQPLAEITNEPQVIDITNSGRDAENQIVDEENPTDSFYLQPLSAIIRVPKRLRKILQKKNSSISTALKNPQKDEVSILPVDKEQKLRSNLVENLFPLASAGRNLAEGLSLRHQVSEWVKDAEQHEEEVSSLERNSPLGETSSSREPRNPLQDDIDENEQFYLAELDSLFALEARLRNLQNTLATCNDYGQTPNIPCPEEQKVTYVPSVEIKEKPLIHVDS